MQTNIDLMADLEKYVFNEENIHIFLKSYENKGFNNSNNISNTISNIDSNINNSNINKNSKKSTIFVPNEKDKLFWCFYIIKYGIIAYEMVENKNIVFEKKIKIEYVEKIRQNKKIIKQYKLSPLTQLEDNLVNDDKLNIHTFLSLCVLENINILFVKKNTCYEMNMNDSNELFILHSLNNKVFGYEESTTVNSENIRNSLFKIDNIDKPLKCIASYKLADLIDIANKLVIELVSEQTNKNKTKQQLYEEIINYFKKNEQ